jgi:hypothetical protein
MSMPFRFASQAPRQVAAMPIKTLAKLDHMIDKVETESAASMVAPKPILRLVRIISERDDMRPRFLSKGLTDLNEDWAASKEGNNKNTRRLAGVFIVL